MENTTYDCLVIGGGIFGVTAAIECAKRNYNVGLINPDTIPHHLAASTDVAKAVRMEYGTDEIYFQMAEKSIEGWREWNQLFEEELYHEVGFLMLCKESLDSEKQAFEKYSFQNLQSAGYLPERLNAKEIKTRFPAISNTTYIEASYNPIAGYVESGRVVERLAQYARSLGVTIHEQQTAAEFIIEKRQLLGVKTKEGNTFKCGHAIVAAGAHTPVLLPELQPYMKATGHPIFWLKPKNYTELLSPYLSVFTADISNSGWYGFLI